MLSHGKTSDKFRNLPAGRLPYVRGESLSWRSFFAYTDVGGSHNSRALVFNRVPEFDEWEGNDKLASESFVAMRTLYDTTAPGAGLRMVCLSHTGTVFAHDEDDQEFGEDTLEFGFVSGERPGSPGAESMRFEDAFIWGDAVPGGIFAFTFMYTDTGESVIGSGKQNVLGATNASPVVFHVPNHVYPAGSSATIRGGAGNWAAVNGSHVVTVVDADHFSIPVDSTAFGAFGAQVITVQPSSGAGTIVPLDPPARFSGRSYIMNKVVDGYKGEGGRKAQTGFVGQVPPGYKLERAAVEINASAIPAGDMD
jgi:hypothetical protein